MIKEGDRGGLFKPSAETGRLEIPDEYDFSQKPVNKSEF